MERQIWEKFKEIFLADNFQSLMLKFPNKKILVI